MKRSSRYSPFLPTNVEKLWKNRAKPIMVPTTSWPSMETRASCFRTYTDGEGNPAGVGIRGGGQGTRPCGDTLLQCVPAHCVDKAEPRIERAAIHRQTHICQVECCHEGGNDRDPLVHQQPRLRVRLHTAHPQPLGCGEHPALGARHVFRRGSAKKKSGNVCREFCPGEENHSQYT